MEIISWLGGYDPFIRTGNWFLLWTIKGIGLFMVIYGLENGVLSIIGSGKE